MRKRITTFSCQSHFLWEKSPIVASSACAFIHLYPQLASEMIRFRKIAKKVTLLRKRNLPKGSLKEPAYFAGTMVATCCSELWTSRTISLESQSPGGCA
jgi:hypothetical protein